MIEDYIAAAQALDGPPGIAAVDLNISCPDQEVRSLHFRLWAYSAGGAQWLLGESLVHRVIDAPVSLDLKALKHTLGCLG